MRKLFTLPNRQTYRFIAAIVGLAILFGISATARTFAADNTQQTGERLISIHDRGVEKGIMTKAATLRSALREAKIAIDANDLVEPGLDAKLIAGSYQVNIYRARPIVVKDGSSSQRILSAYQTPEQIATHAGITLQDEDKTTLSLNDDIVSHGAALQLDIDRATPFSLILYGQKTQAYTQETTVAAMLKAKNITLGKDDTLSVSQDTAISSAMTVEIWRNGKQTINEEQAIDFPVEKIQDANQEVGFHQVKTPGEKGKKIVTYEVVMKNGVEESRKEIQSVVAKEPKKQTEVVGAKISGPAEIIARINYWAGQRGLDVVKVTRIAKCESTFNPFAGNGRYQGLFQHDSTAWAGRAVKYGVAGASIYDPEAQIIVSTGMMASSGYGAWECQ